MATMNDPQFVRELIVNGGYYKDDPPIFAIVRYKNDFNGAFAYGICWHTREFIGYMTSPYCHEPTLLWTKTNGLTKTGKEFLEKCQTNLLNPPPEVA